MKFKYLFLIGFLAVLSQDAFTQETGPNNWRVFASITRYDKANLELKLHMKANNRVVFMGNSITEGWIQMRPDFFKHFLSGFPAVATGGAFGTGAAARKSS